eukprot:PhM_4_TR11657/c0_g2_i5/m.16443
MNSNISTIEHYRKLFQFGFHVTASRALLLLHFSKIYPIHSICHDGCIYHLCSMDTEVVLSFCIDATHILLVDITQPLDNVPSYRTTSINRSQAVCLAVDDHPCVGITKWIEERPSLSFEFITFCAPISYDRAFDWIKDWENVRVVERGVYIDFHDSTNSCHRHCNYAFGDNIKLPIFELALPSSTTSNFTTTSLPDSFLKGCAHLTSVKLSSLTVNNNNNNVIAPSALKRLSCDRQALSTAPQPPRRHRRRRRCHSPKSSPLLLRRQVPFWPRRTAPTLGLLAVVVVAVTLLSSPKGAALCHGTRNSTWTLTTTQALCARQRTRTPLLWPTSSRRCARTTRSRRGGSPVSSARTSAPERFSAGSCRWLPTMPRRRSLGRKARNNRMTPPTTRSRPRPPLPPSHRTCSPHGEPTALASPPPSHTCARSPTLSKRAMLPS